MMPEMDDKKTEAVSVKLPDSLKRYCDGMATLKGVTPSGFIRGLISEDMARTAHDLNLRAEALGAKVIHENLDFHVGGVGQSD